MAAIVTAVALVTCLGPRLPTLVVRARGRRDLARRHPGRDAGEHGLRPAGLLAGAALSRRLPPRRHARLAVVVREQPQPRRGCRHADRAPPRGAVRRRDAARGAERPLLGGVGGAVGAVPDAPRRPVGRRAPRRLRRADGGGAVGRRLRRGRHRAPAPAALQPRRVVGRLLPSAPGRAAPPRLGGRARGARPTAPRPRGRAGPAEPPRPLFPLDRPQARKGRGRRDAAVRAAPARARAPIPARARTREAGRVGASARGRPPLGLRSGR